ncbi:MAG: hypothetical protein K8E24_014280 [Methanobacterium paludis]|nr:hypothetical protein [Methanobacterium paludis]
MKIDRLDIKNKIKEIAKQDFELLNKETKILTFDEKELEDEKLSSFNDTFLIFSSKKFLRIEILVAPTTFLKRFITYNIEARFKYTISYDRKKTIISIEKDTLTEDNFEKLMTLMYMHIIV